MQQALERMTSNVFKSLLLGILVTAAIQSSSATTVIVVGLVNARVLKLRNAIGVIMGANIGTTVTSLIVSLADPNRAETSNFLLNLFKPETFTPVIALVAIVILMTAKKSKTRLISEVMFGFAILFNGMLIMTDALKPISELLRSASCSRLYQTRLSDCLQAQSLQRLSKALLRPWLFCRLLLQPEWSRFRQRYRLF